MIVSFSKKSVILTVLCIVLLGGTLFAAYTMILKPVLKEQEQATQTLEIEKKVLAQLKQQGAKMNDFSEGDSTKLQRQVPVKPLIEQLVLLVERAEVMSSSVVKNIKVTEDAVAEGLDNVKKTSLEVKVKYERYEKMQKFMEVLQSQERIVHIDHVDFTWNIETGEETTYTVTLAAFHAPDIQGLDKELPKIDIPEGSKKKNPIKVQ